ncbi:iron chelate uptake ABC transporter family permease subunit [Sutterella sp.]|uniref:iron chelate uptake ABC transporter family permease subunit n=1 Tax=Sutterella sp. TaxID=1981025 RepID=UPI0026E0A3A5|nr:iron chelate uptake ABC transporter family permease subunit [Sutterella sp.]MDO5531125.1 iron chelate uptake ABC transporter family permease subunit [Sutterella sp.]
MNAPAIQNAVNPRRRRLMFAMTGLIAVTLVAAALYQFAFVNPKFFSYAMNLRAPRLAVMLIAGFAISAAAIVFQTIIRNNIVTPCLLGMNSLYLLIHTAVVFFLGSGSEFATNPVMAFAVDIVLMGVIATFIYYTIFQKTGGNVLYVLLIGTVLSTFFSSMQNSLTRIMDPNEYDALLNSLVASFTNVNLACIIPGVVLLAAIALWLRKDLAILDVISLGRDQAISLGVDYERTLRRLMVGVALYIAVATALVGPLSFLGLITANISRQLFRTYRHTWLIAGASFAGMFILAAGQFLVEHAMTYTVPVSVFVTIGGGVYFLYLILTQK